MNIKPLSFPVFPMMLLVHFTANGQGPEVQEIISPTLLENSTMKIIGSSTLHDLEVEASAFSIEFRIPHNWFDSYDNWAGKEIAALKVVFPVEYLDGGRNKMNRDSRNALRFEDYFEIRFTWDEIIFTGPSDTGRTAEVYGRVMIVGEERDIQFSTNLVINEWL